jgi:hypothetical protein
MVIFYNNNKDMDKEKKDSKMIKLIQMRLNWNNIIMINLVSST